jgi:tetratricopeptide (TPR) repeat protein
MPPIRTILLALVLALLCLAGPACRKSAEKPPAQVSSASTTQSAQPASQAWQPAWPQAEIASASSNPATAKAEPSLFDLLSGRAFDDLEFHFENMHIEIDGRQLFCECLTRALRQVSAIWQETLLALADDQRAMMLYGDRALASGDYYRSELFFRRAIQLDEQNLDAKLGLATVLTASLQYEKSIPAYQQIIDNIGKMQPAASQPASVQIVLRSARFNLAIAYSRLGRLGPAEKVYGQLLQQDPQYLPALFNLATLHSAQGRLMQAKETWTMVTSLAGGAGLAERLSPADTAFAWSQLAGVCMDLDQPGQALDAYSQACKLQSDNVTNWLNLAVAAQSAGQLGQAIVACKQAQKLAPTSDDVYFRLGNALLAAYQASNKRELLAQAIDAWRESLRLNPAQPELLKLLARYTQAYELAGDAATSQSRPG